jgi:hypothetical protein
MQILNLDYGLIIFQAFVLITILLFIISWTIILLTKWIEPTKKLIWLIGTSLLPIVGPVLFFVSLKSLKMEGLSTVK